MSYQVKPGEEEITVQVGATESIRFTVNNTSNRPMLTQTEVQVGGAVDRLWCQVDPATDTSVEAMGSRTYTVNVTPVGIEKHTSGHVRLAVASVDDPSNATPSPEVRVTILPAGESKTWWQLHGKKVLIGVAVLLAAALAAFFIPSGGVRIDQFAAAPAGGAPAGEPVVLTWEVSGEPEAVTLTVGDQPPVMLDESQWNEGPYEVTALTPGPLTVRLTALVPGEHEDEPATEISRKLELVIGEAARTFVPPVVTSFDVSPRTTTAGQPVRFTWATTGDIALLTLDFGNGAPPTLDDPARIAAGSLELPLLAGQYTARATAVGLDGTRAESEPVSFVVNASSGPSVPRVTLSARTAGRSVTVGGTRRSSDLLVTWKVEGEHKSLQVQYLKNGVNPVQQTISTAAGSQTFRSVFVPEGSEVQLLVTLQSGPRLVYPCVVGKPGRVLELPEKFEHQLELAPGAPGAIDKHRVIRSGALQAVRPGGG
jgi:hypothetical protein